LRTCRDGAYLSIYFSRCSEHREISMRHHELDYRVKLRSCHDTHVYNLFLRTRLVVGENFNVISLRQFCHLVIQNFCRGVLIAGKTVGAGQFSITSWCVLTCLSIHRYPSPSSLTRRGATRDLIRERVDGEKSASEYHELCATVIWVQEVMAAIRRTVLLLSAGREQTVDLLIRSRVKST